MRTCSRQRNLILLISLFIYNIYAPVSHPPVSHFNRTISQHPPTAITLNTSSPRTLHQPALSADSRPRIDFSIPPLPGS